MLVIPGEPQPKERPRFNRRNGNFYTPKNTKLYEEAVAKVAISSRARYTKEVTVKVEITLFTGKKKPPDCDNTAKSILDGIVKGGLLEDDSQVGELHVYRVRSAQPRAEVVVSETTVIVEEA